MENVILVLFRKIPQYILFWSDYEDVTKVDTDLPNFSGTMSKPVVS